MAVVDATPPADVGVERSAPAPTDRAAWDRRLAWIGAALIVLALTVAVAHFVVMVSDYRRVFVHPDWHQRILRETLHDGLALGPRDVVNALQLREEGESRPRWLAYFILAVDQKLRLALYDWMPVHPTFAPVTWLIQLVVTPYVLYRLLVNVTASRTAALAGLAVYLSSNGFLSGFTISLLPGKSLSNTAYIVALYLGTLAVRRIRPGHFLVESKGLGTYLLLAALFIGLFLDELPIATFFVLPLFFWSQFMPPWPWRERLGAWAKNAAFFAAPAVAFLLVVVVVMPPIIRSAWGYDFDYLGDTLHLGGNIHSGPSLTEGRDGGRLTPGVVVENFTTLFGLSLVPWQVSPLIPSDYGLYPGSQVTNLPKILVFLVFFGVAGYAAWRAPGQLATQLRGLLVGIALFLLFLTALSIRHIPIATGYYYGAAFASLFALLIAMLVEAVPRVAPWSRPIVGLAVLAIVGVQLVNFQPINEGWVYMHNEHGMRVLVGRMRPGLQKRLPLSSSQDLSAGEVHAIWAAWKRGKLDAYLRENTVTPAAVYEVFELRSIDRFTRGGDDD